jgi:hypothetical protein
VAPAAAAASVTNVVDGGSNVPGAPYPPTRPAGAGGATGAAAAAATAVQPPTESISYSAARVIGNGSFGVVFQATVRETGETVAIKKVLQDKRYKNRELQIMRMLEHTNIVKLKHCFYSSGEKQDEVYLNLVLEYIPETVYRISRHYSKVKTSIPAMFIKLYVYQLLRALAYLHSTNVTHRDIKPQNVSSTREHASLCVHDPPFRAPPSCIHHTHTHKHTHPSMGRGAVDVACNDRFVFLLLEH